MTGKNNHLVSLSENHSNLWRKTFGKLVKAFMTPEERFEENYFFEEIKFCLSFWEFERKISDYRQTYFNREVRNAVYVSRKSFPWVLFEKFTFLPMIFRFFPWKFFQLIAEGSWQACQKRKLCVQGNILRDNILLKKIVLVLVIVFGFQPKFFRTLAKLFQHVGPNCILRVQGKNWANFFSGKTKTFHSVSYF